MRQEVLRGPQERPGLLLPCGQTRLCWEGGPGARWAPCLGWGSRVTRRLPEDGRPLCPGVTLCPGGSSSLLWSFSDRGLGLGVRALA